MNEKTGVVDRAKRGLGQLKAHWKTPPPGYQVSYREFVSFSVGAGSISFTGILVSWTTLAMNIPMIISYFRVSSGMLFLLGILGSLIGLLRAPILSMIIDNTNSPKGKFKPFLIWTTIATGICFGLIPYIPQAWTNQVLFGFHIPSIKLFQVAASDVDVTLGILVMFILLQLGTFFYTLLTQAVTGIEQTISTVAQERANIGSLKGLISNIPGSVVNIVMPLLAGAFFAVGNTTGMNNILLYRVFFPICIVGGLGCVLFLYYGTTERTVVTKTHVNKVRFWEGAKELSKNKYFWILTIFAIATGIRGNANIYFWTCTYAIGGQAGDTAIAICNMVLNNAFIPGMLLGPLLAKRFGKRNVMIVSNVGFLIMVLLQLTFLRNPYLILVGIFFQNLCNSVYFFSAIMVSDVLDYQQWKTGRRLEGFWQNYHSFILTLAGFFTSTLAPLFLSFAGIGFGDNIDVALKSPMLRQEAFYYITILALIGSVIALVPMCFYDLTEKKHTNYVRVLKVRAAVENEKNGCLQEQDVLHVREILAYQNSTQDEFLTRELAQYPDLAQLAETQIP